MDVSSPKPRFAPVTRAVGRSDAVPMAPRKTAGRFSPFAPEINQSARKGRLLSPGAEKSLGFPREFPNDLSRLLNALHAIHRFAGPERHRVERPGRRFVGNERVARVHGNADIRSPRLCGLTDELSVEPLDRLDAGP